MRTDAIENPAVNYDQVRVSYDEVIESIDVLDRRLLRQLRTAGRPPASPTRSPP